MAYPGDPSGPGSKGPGAFGGAVLTPDDFEQLAAAFRPSWEFDEAPFTGAGSIAPSDLRALQGGGGTHADLRTAAQTNGVHARQPGAVSHEPEDSVIIDRTITAADMGAPPPPALVRSVPAAPAPLPAVIVQTPTPPVPVVAAPVTSVPPAVLIAPPPPQPQAISPERLARTRVVQRAPVVVPAAKDSTGSFDAAGSPFKRSKRPLFIGLGAGAAALVAAGIWFSSSGSDPAAPPAPATIAKTVQTAAPDIPPPPPPAETTAAAPAPTPTPRTIPISALAQVPANPPPQAAPPPRPVAVAPAPAPRPAPVAAPPPQPKPAARPKPASATIVHDVPF
jgi:hypothetical protein